MKNKSLRGVRRGAAWSLVVLIKILSRPLPFSVAQKAGSFVGRILHWFSPGMRARILEQMRNSFGDAYTRKEYQTLCRECFRNFGRVGGEFLYYLHMDPAMVGHLVDGSEAEERLEALLQKQKGIIIVTPHFGNWELLAAWLRRSFNGKVIGKRLRVERYNSLLVNARKRLGVETHFQEDSPRPILRVLKKNQIVGILPDQDVVRIAGIFVDFFGRKAYTPTGPASLALASGAPLLPAFMVWDKKKKQYHIRMDEPIEVEQKGDKEEALLRGTEAWSLAFERTIREYPAHWAWFHRRWRTTPERLERRKKRLLLRSQLNKEQGI